MTATRSKADDGSATPGAETAGSATPSKPMSLELLEQENAELRRSGQYRSLFLSRLAHELRTPLTSILGFAEIMLSQEKLSAAQRGFCQRIQSSAQQLQAHLTHLSDLAKLESGQTKLSQDSISPADMLHDILTALARSANKKRLKLACQVAENLPPLISDRTRVRQLIYNALAFSISRSPEGERVNARAETNSAGIVITIEDNGEPIPDPSRIGILAAEDNSANTGELGLSIARQNVEILGGVIAARNLESGIELRIELPNRP